MSFLLATSWFLWRLAQPQNLLAILGGATLGGWLTGLITGAAVRTAGGGRIIPDFVLWIIRSLGGLVCGWIVALYLLGVGSGGIGGSGGLGIGEGKQDASNTGNSKDKDGIKEKLPEKDPNPVVSIESTGLHVEVLTNAEIQQASGPQAVTDERYYRIRNTPPEALLTLKQVTARLDNDRPAHKKVYIVLGTNRPDRDVPRVAELAREVRLRQIDPQYTAP